MSNNKTTSARWRFCSALLPLVFLSACSSGGGGSTADIIAPADTTAPAVTTTTPVNAATAVAKNSPITATLNENIFAVTVDATSFTLATSVGNTPGSITFDSASNVASFTPTSPLGSLTTYTATLGTAITDLSGNPLVANHSWSFTTADGAWGSAEQIEVENAGSASSPQIAFDSNGNALAVWFQWDDTRRNIWANRFDGTNWGAAEQIEDDDVGSALHPQIAFDSNGNALAVWHQWDGTRWNIWANRFDGTNWGAAEQIEDNDAGDAFDSQIAFDNNGNALAVWEQTDGTLINIWANRFDGTNWGAPELIEVDDVEDAFDPQIAFDSNGNALAVWGQFDGTLFNIWANHFDGTTWGTAEQIGGNDGGSALRPQIAFDSNGNGLTVWSQWDGTQNNIWSNRFDGATWGTAELIEGNTGNAEPPQIAFDSNGNALAVWSQRDGTRFNIWANHFDGGSWGTAMLIEDEDAGDAFIPQVAFDSNGNALAVWEQPSDDIEIDRDIWVNRFDGTSWGAAELIEANTGNAVSPQIAVDSNGNALAVWIQFDGIRDNIWANRFDGTNWGTAGRIEISNAGDAVSPQIAVDSNGNALAVWHQWDSTRTNIWANRFE